MLGHNLNNIQTTHTLADYATAAYNTLLYSELTKILQAFEENSIPVIVLKGMAFARTIYPTLASRPMGDIDLLVQPQNREHACQVLGELEYKFQPEPNRPSGPFQSIFTGEMDFRNRHDVSVDLHWELITLEWLRRLTALDTKLLWHDAQPFKLDQAQALQLSPQDALLSICLHLAANAYTHPSGYSDIVQLLHCHSPFPWDAFLARVSNFKLRTMCYFALEVVTIKHSAIPQRVLYALRPPNWQRWLVKHIADPQQGVTSQIRYSKTRSYLLHLLVADCATDIVRILFWLFFPGRRWLGERYRLNPLESFFACFWHPVFVLYQGILGVWELVQTH